MKSLYFPMLFLALSLLCACGGGGGSNWHIQPGNNDTELFDGLHALPLDVDPLGLPAEFSGDAEFITWLVTPGYEALCVFIGGCSDTDVVWPDSGLYDGFGYVRPAYARWTEQLAIPLQ